MKWVRGAEIGCGSFSTVNLAIPTKSCAKVPPLLVAKSSETAFSYTLQNEKHVFDELGVCPQIIRCIGDEYRVEKGQKLYNLFLEYASGGSLYNQRRNRKFTESEIRQYTKTILKGLSYIHAKGFVHCDIKLQNILVFDNYNVKIGDFGLAKRGGEKKQSIEVRGTPLYISPETVKENECESPVDIWALGCAVVEMVTGEPAWKVGPNSNVAALLIRIGVGEEIPQIPEEFSDEGKDFLGKCFLKNPGKRWTAEMLLKHPFVVGVEEEDDNGNGDHDHGTVTLKEEAQEFSKSPRCPFNFPEWLSSPVDRLRHLVTEETPDWSDSDGWVTL